MLNRRCYVRLMLGCENLRECITSKCVGQHLLPEQLHHATQLAPSVGYQTTCLRGNFNLRLEVLSSCVVPVRPCLRRLPVLFRDGSLLHQLNLFPVCDFLSSSPVGHSGLVRTTALLVNSNKAKHYQKNVGS